MEIEGKLLWSSCQEALPPVEAADNLTARLSGFTYLGLSRQAVEATMELHTGLWPCPLCGKWGILLAPVPHWAFQKGCQVCLVGEHLPQWETWAQRPVKSPAREDRGHLSSVLVHLSFCL